MSCVESDMNDLLEKMFQIFMLLVLTFAIVGMCGVFVALVVDLTAKGHNVKQCSTNVQSELHEK